MGTDLTACEWMALVIVDGLGPIHEAARRLCVVRSETKVATRVGKSALRTPEQVTAERKRQRMAYLNLKKVIK